MREVPRAPASFLASHTRVLHTLELSCWVREAYFHLQEAVQPLLSELTKRGPLPESSSLETHIQVQCLHH